MNKEDRKLIEKAKRALGLQSQPKHCQTRDSSNRVENNNFNQMSREKLTQNDSSSPPSNGPTGDLRSAKDTIFGAFKSLAEAKTKSKYISVADCVEYPSQQQRHRKMPAVNPNTLLSSSGQGQFQPLQLPLNDGGFQKPKEKDNDLEQSAASQSSHQKKTGNLLDDKEESKDDSNDSEDSKESGDEDTLEFQLV